MTTPEITWRLPGRLLRFGPRPLVMGVVNVTPDSFSDGGRCASTDRAAEHGLRLAADGADLLDVGGESTRPGADPVPVDEELARVVPVVRALAASAPVPISVDTSKSAVARAALEAGACVINDVTALRGDPDMAAVCAAAGAAVILMHMQGTPQTMQQAPRYGDVVRDIHDFFAQRLTELGAGGIPAERVAVDPGIGFGKTFEHNVEILRRLREFLPLGRPVCLGVSRKQFLGRITGRPVDRRLAGSLAVACYAAERGAAHVVRVHDAAETADALRTWAALAGHAAPTPTEGP